jgi:hypothetical protein
MKKGVCPNCNSSDIYYSTAGIRSSEDNLVLKLDPGIRKPFSRPIGVYVCTACGRMELFLDDQPFMESIKIDKAWVKI